MELVKLLVDAEPQAITHPDNNGQTPLLIAAGQSKADILAAMLDAKTELNLNQQGSSLLNAAIEADSAEVVKLLLGRKLNINAPDQNNRKPLEVAASRQNVNMIVRLLNAAQFLTWRLSLP